MVSMFGETWDNVTRMRSSVTVAYPMTSVPEFERKRFQDAYLLVTAEHGDAIALQILQGRAIEADQKDVEMLSEHAMND